MPQFVQAAAAADLPIAGAATTRIDIRNLITKSNHCEIRNFKFELHEAH